MIPIYSMVALTRDIPDEGLVAGQAGAVVFVHGGGGYEVEFIDSSGDVIDVVSVSETDIEPLRGTTE